MSQQEFNVGDKVQVKGTAHQSKIESKEAGHYRLEKRHPGHCCNYYFPYELRLVEKVKKS